MSGKDEGDMQMVSPWALFLFLISGDLVKPGAGGLSMEVSLERCNVRLGN